MIGPEIGKKELPLEATKNEVLKEVNDTKEYANKTSEWMGSDKENSDLGFINPPSHHDENADPKLDVLKYVIAGLVANDMDIFLSSFHPETVSKDMFKSKLEDKTKVAKAIMRKITRDGQINDVNYKIEKGALSSGTKNELSVTITYKDNTHGIVKMEIIPLNDAHQHESIYVITTSSWEIIKQLKKTTR
ncbi:hypothetical protein [Peribacillus sp. SCS-37]|uniref:hypothetical protein n=1 Tax=Paraperibacillus esterisolvens TaxID=3115296 RepID=UPI0039064740